ncbi:hypothetical protein J0J30_23820, partial [Vibrio vulnificus]|nr:hypothetical protein [Vibrio vulnificus]
WGEIILILSDFIDFCDSNVAFCAEYKVHSYNRNGLCALGFMDDHYPVRSAFSLLNQVILIGLGNWFCCTEKC